MFLFQNGSKKRLKKLKNCNNRPTASQRSVERTQISGPLGTSYGLPVEEHCCNINVRQVTFVSKFPQRKESEAYQISMLSVPECPTNKEVNLKRLRN
jgi:hypothetical protein